MQFFISMSTNNAKNAKQILRIKVLLDSMQNQILLGKVITKKKPDNNTLTFWG